MKTSFLHRAVLSSCCGAWIAAALLISMACGRVLAADAQPHLELVAQGFTSPVALVPVPDQSGRLLIADQIGTIQLLNKQGRLNLFLDLRKALVQLNQGFDERGLLGLALHPDFVKNRRFFVYYSAPLRASGPKGWNHTGRLSEFTAHASEPLEGNPRSERVLLEIDEPDFNHNGGCMAFGPDGLLYVAVGDGGNANDAGLGHGAMGNGQDTTTLLGKILRIDINAGGGKPYALPADNPFVQGGGRPEIYAYGLRNPWRISFDRGGNHDLFAADIGQNLYEEVNIIKKGGNYGWNMREALHCFDVNAPNTPPQDCAKTGARGEPLLDPIIEYKNRNGFQGAADAIGISVTGGYVYRGKRFPALAGRYVFGDWSRSWGSPEGTLLVATPPTRGTGLWKVAPLELGESARLATFVLAFGEDSEGELYVLTSGVNALTGTSGKVFGLK